MERKWTYEQKRAIDTRDRTLLVSAAAGSGKTATLTERIIRSVLDPLHPVPLNRMLIATFTNAAVGELRERIGRAVRDALAKDPGNAALEEQLHMLPAARICTIDAFCNDLLRSCAEEAGLPPGYRIADTAEATLLGLSVMDALVEGIYEGAYPEVATPQEFAAAMDPLTSVRQEAGISELLRALYLKTESTEEGVAVLSPLAEEYDPAGFTTPEATRYGRDILRLAAEMLDHYIARWESFLRRWEDASPLGERYRALLEQDLVSLRELRRLQTLDALRGGIENAAFSSIPARRGQDVKTADMEAVSAERTRLRADLKDFSARYLYATAAEWRELYASVHPILRTVCRTLEKYDALLREQKRRRALCEYADIERYTYRLLWKDGERTDLARSVSERYDQIYLDEYQDVNRLQNKIFEAVSRPDNRFMVGDIKQSIYSFRSADPSIFAQMKEEFPPLDGAGGKALSKAAETPGKTPTVTPKDPYTPPASLFMSSNFRCDRGIVDFVNSVFDRMFGAAGESIGYVPQDRLICAKVFEGEEPPYRVPEVHVLARKPRATPGEEFPLPDEDGEDLLAAELTARQTEARFVARQVSDLLAYGISDSGKPYTPGDIALLLRDARGKAELYAEALEAAGIPTAICGEKDFFLNSEVLLALALLNTVDNPRKDVYLAALLCSPLFGFSADELAAVRTEGEGRTLYDSLLSYTAAHPEAKKCAHFLSRLSCFRKIAEGTDTPDLLHRLYRDTGLLSLVGQGSARDNLMLLCTYAAQFEESSYKGLYSFINYINTVIDGNQKFEAKQAEAGDADRVRIVTVHGSKGLEYPVCFLVDTGSALLYRDGASRLGYVSDYGLSVCPRAKEGLALLENPMRAAINEEGRRRNYEESLRILYVAMTRARERLVVVGTSTADPEARIEQLRQQREYLSSYAALHQKSFLDMIITCGDGKIIPHSAVELGYAPAAEADIPGPVYENSGDALPAAGSDTARSAPGETQPRPAAPEEAGQSIANAAPGSTSAAAPEQGEQTADAEAAQYRARFSFRYPGEQKRSLPEKISVSRLYPAILDEADRYTVSLFSEEEASEEEDAIETDAGENTAGQAAAKAAPGQEGGNSAENTQKSLGKNTAKTGDIPRPVYENDGNTVPAAGAEPARHNPDGVHPRPGPANAAEEPRRGQDGRDIVPGEPPTRPHGMLPFFLTGKREDESRRRGIITHTFLQFCDLGHLAEKGAEAELDRLISDGFMRPGERELVRLREVELFRRSELFARMRAAVRTWRELRFHVRLPAGDFTEEPERRAALRGETVLVQGVIDCLLENPDGTLSLVDYKTDRMTRAEYRDHTLAAAKLAAKHTRQLTYYAEAVEQMLGRRPATVEVYSMPLGITVPLDIR